MLKGIIINNSVEFNFAQSHVRENKSGEIFPQYYTSGFGEIFPWRKFPAIRYVILLIHNYKRDTNEDVHTVYTSYSVHVYTSEQTQCVLISTHLECNFSQ